MLIYSSTTNTLNCQLHPLSLNLSTIRRLWFLTVETFDTMGSQVKIRPIFNKIPGPGYLWGERAKGSNRNLQKKPSGIVRTQCPILYTWFIFLSDERWRYSFSWCENLCHIRSWFVTTCWVVSCHHQTHSEQTRQASALLATKFHPSGSILSLFWMPLPKWSSDDNS